MSLITNTKELQKTINYYFTDIELLIQCLTHPSVKRDDSDFVDYERFELLGDSILNLIITEYIFHKFQLYNEGKLAKLRAFLVSKDSIYKIALKINIRDSIIMTKGEELSGGRDNPNNLENVVEALIAGIYLDSDIFSAKKVILDLWSRIYGDFSSIDISNIDPKSTLQEESQSRFKSTPQYKLLSKTGYDHSPTFTVALLIDDVKREVGTGTSIKNAEKDAAQKFLDGLKSS